MSIHSIWILLSDIIDICYLVWDHSGRFWLFGLLVIIQREIFICGQHCTFKVLLKKEINEINRLIVKAYHWIKCQYSVLQKTELSLGWKN